MKLSFWIALKYFFSNKKRSFIHFISIISMLGLALGTAALIVILSVFNGLEDLNRQVFKAFDPDIKIALAKGDRFEASIDYLKKIESIREIKTISKVLQVKALAKGDEAQIIVVLNGVSTKLSDELNSTKVEGEINFENGQAVVGAGIPAVLNINVKDFLHPLTLTYPSNQDINMLNPDANLNSIQVIINGVFAMEQQYDNYVYLPLHTVDSLTESNGQVNAIDIELKPGADAEVVQEKLADLLGGKFSVKTRDQQNEALFKAIRIEKLFIFVALMFIICIASFNIFYGLSMLVIDKKDDIFSLASLGYTENGIRNIFISEGLIIGLVGVILGLFIGLGISFLQQKFGLLKLGMQYAMVDAYPIKIEPSDVILSCVGVLFISILASIFPAKKALVYCKLR